MDFLAMSITTTMNEAEHIPGRVRSDESGRTSRTSRRTGLFGVSGSSGTPRCDRCATNGSSAKFQQDVKMWSPIAALIAGCCGKWTILLLPSGKRLRNYGKSPFLMGKSTISMAIFNSFLYVYQRVQSLQYRSSMYSRHCYGPRYGRAWMLQVRQAWIHEKQIEVGKSRK